MEQLNQNQAIEFYQSGIWKDWDNEKIVRFQLFQKLLCVDFSRFHEAIEDVLGRPIYTHEFGLNYKGLIEEYLGLREAPTFQEIIEMIPEDKRIILVRYGMEIRELEESIRKASYYYYNEPKKSTMSDAEFDSLVQELKEKAPNSPVLNEIGAPAIEGKVWHYKKMYSLDNAMDLEEAQKFVRKFGNVDFVVSQKMDGASLEVVYFNGYLHSISSRGDGLWGDEVLHAKCLVPDRLPEDVPKVVAIYGEVVISGPAFEAIGNGYSSPRNLAAGSIMTKDDPDVLIDRGAQFLAFDMTGHYDYGRKLQILEDYGFTTVPFTVTRDITGVILSYQTLLKLRDEFYQKYGPSDGVVVRVDNADIAEKYGYGDKYPKFAIAWKFPHEEKIVEITYIRWDVSKNGRLTPVAEFDGVEIDGAVITNCTLHNAKTVYENGLGPGAKIKIIRSGGVIPKFIDLVSHGYVEMVAEDSVTCPSCGTKGAWDDNHTFLLCPNEKCPAQLADYIVEFFNRLEYKGLGDKSGIKLVEYGCNSPVDVFKMEPRDFSEALSFSPIHASEVYQSLQDLKKVPYERFLYALNIDMLGRRFSKQFAQKVSPEDFEHLVNYWAPQVDLDCAGCNVFSQVFGGGITASRMFESFVNKAKYIKELFDVGFEIRAKKKVNGGSMKFVITGTLNQPRKYYEDLIEEKGHEYQSSLTKTTDFLVIGENTGANKIAKAEKFGTKKITEKGLIDLLGD